MSQEPFHGLPLLAIPSVQSVWRGFSFMFAIHDVTTRGKFLVIMRRNACIHARYTLQSGCIPTASAVWCRNLHLTMLR